MPKNEKDSLLRELTSSENSVLHSLYRFLDKNPSAERIPADIAAIASELEGVKASSVITSCLLAELQLLSIVDRSALDPDRKKKEEQAHSYVYNAGVYTAILYLMLPIFFNPDAVVIAVPAITAASFLTRGILKTGWKYLFKVGNAQLKRFEQFVVHLENLQSKFVEKETQHENPDVVYSDLLARRIQIASDKRMPISDPKVEYLFVNRWNSILERNPYFLPIAILKNFVKSILAVSPHFAQTNEKCFALCQKFMYVSVRSEDTEEANILKNQLRDHLTTETF